MDFLWSDAWLLDAIACASSDQDSATLAEVIAAFDGRNHTLPNPDELHGGLVRLTAGRFVEEVHHRFKLTDRVPGEAVTRMVKGGRKLGHEAASTLLGAEAWTEATNVADPRNQARYPGLTDERLWQADQEYRRILKRRNGTVSRRRHSKSP
jgi:hypothetical protein